VGLNTSTNSLGLSSWTWQVWKFFLPVA